MILAIDPGTNKLGVALFTNSSHFLVAFSIQAESKSPNRRERSVYIINKLVDYVTELQPEDLEIALEEPLLRGNSNKAMERLLGMIEFVFKNYLIHYYAPMTVKAAMGSGSFDKDQMYNALIEVMPDNTRIEALKGDYDAVDAVCIGLTHFKKQKEKLNDSTNKQLPNSTKTKKRRLKAKTTFSKNKKRITGTSSCKKKRKK